MWTRGIMFVYCNSTHETSKRAREAIGDKAMMACVYIFCFDIIRQPQWYILITISTCIYTDINHL